MIAQENPIFLLGTGRCGSTYWQKMLCNTDDIWIWGEHDGLLLSFSHFVRVIRPDSLLTKLSLTRQTITDTTDIGEGDATLFAWNNGFSEELLLELAREFITRLFKANMPSKKRRWGFKEIRYGMQDDLPELLLTLFPAGKVVVTVRSPIETIISSLAAWHHTEITNFISGEKNKLSILARSYVERWILFSNKMEALQRSFPTQVGAVHLENPHSPEILSSFLVTEIPYRETPKNIQKSVNQNPRKLDLRNHPTFIDMIDSTLEPHKSELKRLDTLFQTNFCQDSTF